MLTITNNIQVGSFYLGQECNLACEYCKIREHVWPKMNTQLNLDVFNFLKENNIPRTIATMSEWDNVEFYIKEFNLAKWFDLDKIVYSNGKIPGKPAPDIFLIAAEKIGLNPKDCLVFEDAIAGINAAKSAGIGKIIAVDSMEPVEFYQGIDGLSSIITNFNEVDRSMFQASSVSI